jgi:hypothetical protein
VFETVTLQAVAHARMRQRITDVSPCFDYMRIADNFTFTQTKSSAAYIRVIFKFLT